MENIYLEKIKNSTPETIVEILFDILYNDDFDFVESSTEFQLFVKNKYNKLIKDFEKRKKELIEKEEKEKEDELLKSISFYEKLDSENKETIKELVGKNVIMICDFNHNCDRFKTLKKSFSVESISKLKPETIDDICKSLSYKSTGDDKYPFFVSGSIFDILKNIPNFEFPENVDTEIVYTMG
jgi:hypothetical protein